ncbi:ABC transporter permease [Luteimonas mephitis]|uniref:ABC transporter permease n=1 Tax=Luteimonas mephitis TaxID=83615 RepID=UPI000A03D60D|nr:ABC transporter permease [Luteimonas mephitis]
MSGAALDAPTRASTRANAAPGAFWRELRESFRYPEFWALSSWLDIIVRARKSRFGIVWLLAPSIVYVFGLGTFFRGMQSDADSGDFFVHVALGAMIFRTLMSSVIGSANVFHSSVSFIMDGHMRLTDYLLQSLAKSFFDMCMYLPVVAVALILFGDISLQGLLVSIPVMVLIYINALWIAAIFALAGARFPDFGQLLNTVSIFLFLLTPIIWYPEMMPAGSMRAQLMRFNPFYHFVEIFRSPIMGQPVEMTSIWYVGVMTVVGLAVATVAYRRYARYVPLWI